MRNKIIKMVKDLKEDADYREIGNRIIVTIDDFLGFNDDFEEEFREYDDTEKVDAFIDFLESKCINSCDDYYTTYYFEGFEVVLGYTSFDI